MNRLDRLQAILIHLQSKKVVTAQEIANRFAISIRTVYRDIRSLEEAGVPIGAEAGIGYFLTDNYHLPPVMFTNKEASALLFGAKFVEQHADTDINTAFESALFKIKAILRSSEKEHIDILHKFITVNGRSFERESQNLFLHDIQIALVENRKLSVHYTAAYSGESSARVIVPLTLCFYGMQWHVIAFCQLRNQYRDFRLDRINTLLVCEETFERCNYKTADEYFESLKENNEAERIVLSMSCEAALKIYDYKFMYGFTHQVETNGEVEMYFYNNDIDGFARWIVYSGCKVTVLYPKELQACVVRFVEQLSAWYLKGEM